MNELMKYTTGALKEGFGGGAAIIGGCNFGERVKEYRNKKGVSIREMSRATGISHPYLSQIENLESNNISYSYRKIIEDYLGMNDKSSTNNTSLMKILSISLSDYSTDELLEEIKKRIDS